MAWPRAAALLALATVAVGLVVRDEAKVEISSVGNTVFGQHFGSFLVFNTTFGHGDAYALEVQLVEVHEVSLGGGQLNHKKFIGSSPNAHSASFAAGTRAFTSPRTNITEVYDKSASGIVLNTLVGQGNEVEFQAFILEEAGEVGPSPRQADVGDVYLRINVKEWNFCGSCVFDVCTCLWSDGAKKEEPEPTSYIGAFIDFKFLISSYSPMNVFEEGVVDLGGGAAAFPFSIVTLDGGEKNQPAQYPSLTREGSQMVLTMRVPKFDSTAQADVVLHLPWLDNNPPWTFPDYWMLFGWPALTFGSIVACLALVCRPRAEKDGYMLKKLKQVRQQRARETKRQREKELAKREEQELKENPHGRALLAPDGAPAQQSNRPQRDGSGPLGQSKQDSLERGEGRPKGAAPGAGSKLMAPPKAKGAKLDV